MELKEFTEKMKEVMESCLEDIEITVKCTTKNNGLQMIGLEFKGNSNIAPVIYMNTYYEAFCDGYTIEELTKYLIEEYRTNKSDLNVNIMSLIDFENAKFRITYKLINYEMNKDMLKELPHMRYLDLAKIYVINLHAEEYANSEIKIHHGFLQFWNKSIEEIDAIATENTEKMFTAKIISMDDALREIMKKKGVTNIIDEEIQAWLDDVGSEQTPLYIATNQYGQYGANIMCYKDVIKNFANSKESVLYILPSSVHELLLMKTSEMGMEKEYVKSMVYEVNRSDAMMQTEYILSDNVYLYSREKDSIEIV